MATKATEIALDEIQSAYEGRVAHARSLHRMAVTAADSRLRHEMDSADEIRQAQLGDLKRGGYTPPMFGVGVTRLAELPAQERKTGIEA